MKRAFTMIELIFVIVILGILAVFSTDMIVNMYRGYVYSKAVNELETKVEIALEQISSRLSERIRITTIGRDSSDNSFVDVDEVRPNHDILEWYGQSSESKFFMNGNDYGWSGFLFQYGACGGAAGANGGQSSYTACFGFDGTRNITQIRTPATRFQSVNTVASALGSNSAALVFPNNSDVSEYYDVNPTAAPVINMNSTGDTIQFAAYQVIDTDSDTTVALKNHYIAENYYVTHSAYALVPGAFTDYTYNDGGGTFRDFPLNLHYNYYPWQGGRNAYEGATIVTLIDHVTLFRFRGNDGSVEIKLCARDPLNLPNDQDFIVCKSKVVL